MIRFKEGKETKRKRFLVLALSAAMALGISIAAVAGNIDSPGDPSAESSMYTLKEYGLINLKERGKLSQRNWTQGGCRLMKQGKDELWGS